MKDHQVETDVRIDVRAVGAIEQRVAPGVIPGAVGIAVAAVVIDAFLPCDVFQV